MSRGIRIGLIIAVAVVLTYPLAAWVIGMVVGNQNGAAALQRLATLQRQGYVKEAAAQYTIHVTYEHGKTVVNALPFPPVGPH
jgi:hypothetical protein